MTTQRIYIIGAGIIARTHAAAARILPDLDEVTLAVADPNEQALAEFVDQFPEARTFSDASTMLAEPAQENDIVVVATPPASHEALTCAALSTGRHVLCEKPLALDREQAQRMLSIARASKRLLGCCSVRFLGWPPAEEARRLLHEGVLGQIYHIRFSVLEQRNRPGIEYQPETLWFLDRARSGGGTLMDRAPYEFSMLNELLQPSRVDVLGAWLANPLTALSLPSETINDVEQHAGAMMRYYLPDDTVATLTYERASCTHSEPRSSIEVEGLRGTLRWDWPSWSSPLRLLHSYDNNGCAESRSITFPHSQARSGPRFSEKPLLYFYQRMLNQPSRAVVNEQAVFNFSCFQAIYDCARSGQSQSVGFGS